MQSEGTKINKIEVAIVMDVTGSMQQWIDAARDTVIESFSTLQSENSSALFRLACVCYRDFGDEVPFVIAPFTEDISSVQNTLKNTKASGGSDQAEDVAGALEKVLELNWSDDTSKLILWVCDAPPHGNKYHSILIDDRYPKGDPKGREPSEQVKQLYLKGVDFTMFRICKSIDKMVEIFSSIYNQNDESVTFTLLDVTKQAENSRYRSIRIDTYDTKSLISGFIDLSTYDDSYDCYPYGSCDEENKEENIADSGITSAPLRRVNPVRSESHSDELKSDIAKTFCSSTIESVRKTIEKSNKKVYEK